MRDTERMAAMAALVHTALDCATLGLTDPTVALPDQLTAADRALHQLLDELDDATDAMADGSDLAAGATDPRVMAAEVHLGNELEALAGLIQQITGIAWARHERGPFPPPLRPPLQTIGEAALALVVQAVKALGDATSVDLSAELAAIAHVQRRLYDTLPFGADPVDVAEAALLGCHLRHSAECAAELAANADLLEAPGVTLGSPGTPG